MSRKSYDILMSIASIGLIGCFMLLLIVSLKINISSIFAINVPAGTIIADFFSSFLRVTISSIVCWVAAIILGGVLNNYPLLRQLTDPLINLIRHISPFAWFPFAIIWFGLGEQPIFFVLSITLFFPALVSVRDIFLQISQDYYDEAKVCGANPLQIFSYIEVPLTIVPLLNLYRILWGLGWTMVIAAEMLGTAKGLGYRLLDFRYLLYYPEMIMYIILMGIAGVVFDRLLRQLVKKVGD